MAGRPKRNLQKLNYNKINEYGMDEVDMSPDDDSFFTEEETEDEMEEGELDEELDFLNMSEKDFDLHVNRALEEGDEEKTIQLLAMKQR